MILFFIFYDFQRTSYRSYTLPVTWDALGWCIVGIAGLMIPITAGIKVHGAKQGETVAQVSLGEKKRWREINRPETGK